MASHQITLKISTLSGNSWITGFNGTMAEALAYFPAYHIEEDQETGKETRDLITRIEQLP